MATINERKSASGKASRWQAIVRLKGQPAQTKTFRTKAEAVRWSRAVESEIDKGTWRDKSRAESTSVADLLTRYQSEILPEKKSRQSVESVIHILCMSELGKFSLAQLLPESIAKYRDKRLSMVSEKTRKPLSTQTVRHEMSLLSRVLNHAMREWGIPLPLGNPCLQIKMPAQAKARDRRLVDDEEERLLDACTESRNQWLHPAVIFAIETAMRAGEILETWKYLLDDKEGKKIKVKTKASDGLQWSDVDLNKRTAHLPKTKNGDARTVPLSSRAVQVLRDLPRNLDDTRVFGTTYEGIHQAFARACKRAGIEDLRFHDLRHEATSRFFEKGFTNPLEVAAITGHKDMKMLKRYTHFKAEDLAKKLQ